MGCYHEAVDVPAYAAFLLYHMFCGDQSVKALFDREAAELPFDYMCEPYQSTCIRKAYRAVCLSAFEYPESGVPEIIQFRRETVTGKSLFCMREKKFHQFAVIVLADLLSHEYTARSQNAEKFFCIVFSVPVGDNVEISVRKRHGGIFSHFAYIYPERAKAFPAEFDIRRKAFRSGSELMRMTE